MKAPDNRRGRDGSKGVAWSVRYARVSNLLMRKHLCFFGSTPGLDCSFGRLQLELSSLSPFPTPSWAAGSMADDDDPLRPLSLVWHPAICYKHRHPMFWVGYQFLSHFHVHCTTGHDLCFQPLAILELFFVGVKQRGPIFALNKDSLCWVLWQTPNFMPVEN